MDVEPKSPETILREARAALKQEWTHLQIVDRALKPEELRRSEALGHPAAGPGAGYLGKSMGSPKGHLNERRQTWEAVITHL